MEKMNQVRQLAIDYTYERMSSFSNNSLKMGENKIICTYIPLNDVDLVNKKYVDKEIQFSRKYESG